MGWLWSLLTGGTVEGYRGKIATTSRSNTISVSDDPDLTIQLAANALYAFIAFIRPSTVNGNSQGVRIIWNYSGTIGTGGFKSCGQQALNSTQQISNVNFALNVQAGLTTLPDAVNDYVLWIGEIHTTTAGTLSLQWAQVSSAAQASQVLAGSFLRVARMG
jgi:hypothetical protein